MSGRQEPEPQSANSAGLLHPPDITHTFLTVHMVLKKCNGNLVLKKFNGNSTLLPLYFLYLYHHVVIKILSGKAQKQVSEYILQQTQILSARYHEPLLLPSHISNTYDVL